MFEAKWNNCDEQKAAADTIQAAIETVLSISHGAGYVYVYEMGHKTPLKIVTVTE